MSERKPIIGLSWEPKLPASSSGIRTKTCDKSNSQAENSLVWKTNSELVDGLFVPPNKPKKLNKLLRKQVSDTAGRNWYMLFSIKFSSFIVDFWKKKKNRQKRFFSFPIVLILFECWLTIVVDDILNYNTHTLVIVTRFDMPAQTVTPEVEKDLRLLKVSLHLMFHFILYQFSFPLI